MPKTRRDVIYTLCEKIGGEKGRIMRIHFEQLGAQGKVDDSFVGKMCARLDEEISEEEFAASLRTMEKTYGITREWEKFPPVKTWDRRN